MKKLIALLLSISMLCALAACGGGEGAPESSEVTQPEQSEPGPEPEPDPDPVPAPDPEPEPENSYLPWPENELTALIPVPADAKVLRADFIGELFAVDLEWTMEEGIAYAELLADAGFGADCAETFESYGYIDRTFNGTNVQLLDLFGTVSISVMKAEGEPDQTGQEAVPEVMSGTKTMEWFMEYASTGSYTMETAYEMEGLNVTSLSVYDGGRVYTETDMDGTKSISILMDDSQYVLDPASKTCIKMSVQTGAMQELVGEAASDYEAALSAGEMEVNGTTCFYEEFSVGGGNVRYCFDGDELKYMITQMEGMEFTMEVLRMEKGADQSVFDIPADYSMMSF